MPGDRILLRLVVVKLRFRVLLCPLRRAGCPAGFPLCLPAETSFGLLAGFAGGRVVSADWRVQTSGSRCWPDGHDRLETYDCCDESDVA